MSIELLLERNSAAVLTEPAPSDAVLSRMIAAALRAPDHGVLKPYRFIRVSGDRRDDLGELFAAAAEQRLGAISQDSLDKFVAQPKRAPLIVVVVARLVDHPKVPQSEQLLTAGCAAYGLLLAAEAEGFAGIWRTGDNAFDETVARGLGLSRDEEIIGFLYIGTRKGSAKVIAPTDPDDFLTTW